MGKKMSDSANALLLLKLWQNKHNTTEIDFTAASIWADANNLYPKPPISRQKRCEDEMRRAVKRVEHLDKQGRSVRTYGALPLFDGTFSYIEMDRAKPKDAIKILDFDFKGLENHAKKHSMRLASYNDNGLFGAQLPPYDYDLNGVVQDATMSGEYDDSYDGDETDSI